MRMLLVWFEGLRCAIPLRTKARIKSSEDNDLNIALFI